MKLSDFDYDLPEKYIAQTPLEKRDHSKMLVYDRATGRMEIKHFYNIIDYLRAGDVLVVNNTRVMPARLIGTKEKTGASIEVLLIKKVQLDTYSVLVKPLKRLRIGDSVDFGHKLTGTLLSKDEAEGTAIMRFAALKNYADAGKAKPHEPQSTSLEALFDELGTTPLPHYITTPLARAQSERYQTVYNRILGSAAAPTAGLHWTPELIQKAKERGVIFCEVLLHVGLGTFRPVKCDDITEHKMHSEYFEISQEVARTIQSAKAEGRRVICVGTTSIRTLEGGLARGKLTGETDIFIYPPYKFTVVDSLVTNFHLPKSTLLMLVSAFIGNEDACNCDTTDSHLTSVSDNTESLRRKTLELYQFAKANDFRFFSFGDCMLIL